MKKFQEPLSTAVFTTKFVLEGSTVLFVFHDEDGSWQFHGREDDVNEEDMRLIGLGEMIDLDKTILDLADLPNGFEATRSDKSSPWRIMNSN